MPAGLEQWNCAVADLSPDKPLPQRAPNTMGQQASAILARSISELSALITLADNAGDRDTAQRLSTTRNKLEQQAHKLQQSPARGARQQAQLTPAGALRNWLYPRDKPQERVMSSIQAIWHYGPGIAQALVNAASTSKDELFF